MKRSLTEKQLHALLDSMKLINSTLDLDSLLTVIINEITQNLEAERSSLFIVDKEKNEIWSKIAEGAEKFEIRQPIGKGISGQVARTGEAINIKDAYQDSRFNPAFDKKTGYRTKSILCMPVRDKTGETIAVVQALNKKRGHFGKEDETFLSVFSEYIALTIQNARLYQEALERKKLEGEISLAGEIQRLLLPQEVPQINGYRVFAHHHPSRQIGGDYYDFFRKPNRLCFVIADVVGKGVPAALLMANLQATAHQLSFTKKSAREIVCAINRHLCAVTAADKYVTMVWGTIDLTHHRLKYVNGGHLFPLHFQQKNGRITTTELQSEGIPVGFMSNFEFEEGETDLSENDLLLLCSDGITEAQDEKGEMFETDRVIQIVKKNFHQNVAEIGSEIIRQVHDFSKEGIYEDDTTLLLFRRIEKMQRK